MVLYAGVGDLTREMGVGEVPSGILQTARTRGLKQSSRFRALLLTEDDSERLELARA
jgi:hypothetical protein